MAAEGTLSAGSERPNALVAVLAKGKTAADAWARRFTAAGLSGVRRAARSDFSFQPAEFGPHDRHLLHVAITRGRGVLASGFWAVRDARWARSPRLAHLRSG